MPIGVFGPHRVAFGDLLPLQPEELDPESLRLLVLSLPSLPLLAIPGKRCGVELDQGRAIDRRVIVNDGTGTEGLGAADRWFRICYRGPADGARLIQGERTRLGITVPPSTVWEMLGRKGI